jgi:hypothetical protein
MRPCRSTAAPLTSCDFQSKPQAGPAWEALETLLRTQAQWTENDAGRVDLALARLGVDVERLTADMAPRASTASWSRTCAMHAPCRSPRHPNTSSMAGRCPRFGFDQLVALVKEELQSASSAK